MRAYEAGAGDNIDNNEAGTSHCERDKLKSSYLIQFDSISMQVTATRDCPLFSLADWCEPALGLVDNVTPQ